MAGKFSREWLQRNLNTIVPIAATIALVLAMWSINPVFFSHQGIITLIYSTSWFLIAAIGLTFVILMGSFDFSVPSVLKLSALICGIFLPQLGLGVIPLALAVSAVIGIVNGLILTKFNVPSFMATLATSVLVEGIALILSRGYIYVITDPTFLGLTRTFIPPQIGLPSIFYWAIAFWAIAVFLTLSTPFGRAIYAIGGNIHGAKLAGINIDKVRILTFMLSALYAGLAGVLFISQKGGGSMAIGQLETVPLFASIVVGGTALSGGVGGIHRTLLGAIVITWLDSGLSMLGFDLNIRMIVFGAVAIVMTMLTIDRRRIKLIK